MGEDFFTRARRWYQLKPPTLRMILTINVVVYVLWIVVFQHIAPVAELVLQGLVLQPDVAGTLVKPWQLLTYHLLHLGGGLWGFIHILFNLAWLVWIGQEYEELYGSRNMAWLYLASGIGGGLLVLLFAVGWPGTYPVYGATAPVLGVMAAVATLYPHKSIGLWLIGVVPLKYIVIGFLVLDILFSGGITAGVVAVFGGALAGYLYAKFKHQGGMKGRSRTSEPDAGSGGGSVLDRLDAWLGSRTENKPKKQRSRTSTTDAQVISEVDQSAVDRILDKISEKGYDALTEEEKRILYEASRD